MISSTKIGERLRMFRMEAGLSMEEVAGRTGISRAAIHRYERGQPIRTDALGKIADLLGVSLAFLLGAGAESISSAGTFFERLQDLEADADQIMVLFGPVPYLLTTDAYDRILPALMLESGPTEGQAAQDHARAVAHIASVLKQRKARFRQRKTNLIALLSVSELEHFLSFETAGTPAPDASTQASRQNVARGELRNIVSLIEEQPLGIQIGIVQDSIPSTNFEIARNGDAVHVATSPFRLGPLTNVRVGVASITSAEEAVRLNRKLAQDLWRDSLKGDRAAQVVKRILGSG